VGREPSHTLKFGCMCHSDSKPQQEHSGRHPLCVRLLADILERSAECRLQFPLEVCSIYYVPTLFFGGGGDPSGPLGKARAQSRCSLELKLFEPGEPIETPNGGVGLRKQTRLDRVKKQELERALGRAHTFAAATFWPFHDLDL